MQTTHGKFKRIGHKASILMTSKPLIRPYRPGDDAGINHLFNRVFGLNRSLDQMRWEFMQGPVSRPECSVVAEDRGEIVGFFGSLFHRIQIDQQEFRTAYGVDNAIDPRYRGGFRGLQYQMWQKQMELWKRESIPFALGFPNREAYVVGKRLLKYRQLAELEILHKRLNYRLAIQNRLPGLPETMVRAVRRVSTLLFRMNLTRVSKPASHVFQVDRFPNEIDIFAKEFGKQYPAMLLRDQAYLNWRYAPEWGRGYRIWIARSKDGISGIGVGRILEQEGTSLRLGLIMELATLPPHDAFHGLLREMLLSFLKQGADGTLARLSPYDPTVGRLKAHGFHPRAEIWDRRFAYRLIRPDRVNTDRVLDVKSWHTTFGDSDSL